MRLFRVGTLIDGTGAAPVQEAAILIDGDRIVAVGRRADIEPPEGTVIVDRPGRTAIPGLIDAHVHLAFSGIPHNRAFRAELAELSYPAIALRAAKYARDTVEAGFTSVRDMHAAGGTIIDLRNAIDAGQVEGPRIKACGLGLSVTGGHMDQPGWPDHAAFAQLTLPCDGPDSFRAGLRSQVKRGADFIKINACVGARKDPAVPFMQEMTDAEIEAACSEAHALGLKVASHTSGGSGLLAAVRLGVDTIEHGHFADDKIIDLMAEKGTFLVPTLLVNERNFEFTPEEQGINAAGWRWLQQARAAKWDLIPRALEAGVRIVCGSDTGFMLAHGERNAEEIELLIKGGLTPMQALTAATATAADAIEIDAGRLSAGKLADILIVDGDPLADIRVLQDRNNLEVFKGGRSIGSFREPEMKRPDANNR